MSLIENILGALTPGHAFNPKEKTWRSMRALVQFAGADQEEVMECLQGDLVGQVTLKPSQDPARGVMVCLNNVAAAQVPASPEQISILGGNAVGPADAVGAFGLIDDDASEGITLPDSETAVASEAPVSVDDEDLEDEDPLP